MYVYIYIYFISRIFPWNIREVSPSSGWFPWQVQAQTGGVGVDAILALEMDLSPEDGWVPFFFGCHFIGEDAAFWGDPRIPRGWQSYNYNLYYFKV